MKTFNQLYDFVLTNQTIQHITKSKLNTKGKYFKHNINGKLWDMPIENNHWYEVGVEFRRQGFKEHKLHKHYNIFGDVIDLEKNRNAATVYIHCSLTYCWMPKIEFSINNKRHSFWPRSNRPITNESIYEEVFKYINKVLLYPDGLFKRIQLHFCLDKKATLQKYKQLIRIEKETKQSIDIDQIILRRYGCINNDIYDEQKLARAARLKYETYGKLPIKEISKLKWVYDGDGDIDELELEYNEYINNHENTIFI